MKTIITILLVFVLAQVGFGQDTIIQTMATSAGATIVADGKLEITIHKRSTLTDNEYHLISGFLYVNKSHPSKNNTKHTDLNNYDYNALYNKVKSIDFTKLKGKYVDNAAADSDLEYEFIIKLDGETYNVHIYKVKVKPILKLVKTINHYLSEKDKIGYNKFYLNR